MKHILLFIIISLLMYPAVKAQRVSAYQAGSYQSGLMNVRDLAPPDAGLVFIDYNFWNNSNAYIDQYGNEVSSMEIDLAPIDPSFGSLTLDLEQQVSGYANVPVLFYSSKFKILNARYMASINPVYLTSNYRMNIHVSDTTINSTGNAGGFGDLSFIPLGLGWSIKDRIDVSFFYTVYAPTGKYKTGASDNIGKGYWTHQFQIPFYYYFMEKATALFVMPTFEVNGYIKDSDFRAGNRFTIEYGYSQYVTSWLELEIINGHNWQISDDKGEDFWWKKTQLDVRDQTSSVGFGVGVWPWEGRLNIRVKYAMDYAVKQRYKSNFLSASIIFIPNILAEKVEE
jgi:hypothetical protein